MKPCLDFPDKMQDPVASSIRFILRVERFDRGRDCFVDYFRLRDDIYCPPRELAFPGA